MPPDAAKAWSALHRFVLQPTLPPRTQRLVHSLGRGVGRLLIVEGPAMALGVAVNEHSAAVLTLTVTAAGNHAAVCGAAGPKEGSPNVEQNANLGQRKKGSGPREPRPDWRDFLLEGSVPPQSQQLLFVAVALADQHWEFCLESVMAEQLPHEFGAATAWLPAHPFAPASVEPRELATLPGGAEIVNATGGGGNVGEEDLDLLAAMAMSLIEGAGSAESQMDHSKCADSAGDFEPDAADMELEAAELDLAMQMSLADQQNVRAEEDKDELRRVAPAMAQAKAESGCQSRAGGRWGRRAAAAAAAAGGTE
eukprot:gnl/TRDRNA2_/TRDRNA2_170749_c1_seq1.p2 gnl/TRDRNA2_/TRDRNA2_170749_c1~~gnl/TRDRNA2_/TRDRNA2_170749_c1_seq1.p2  ORF type:complete len:344 (+),score=75.67 gnl/TRDRNA2_/TRDRNA2_170749_c1_seq1:107-1033(+)